jgi:hypothetical protein
MPPFLFADGPIYLNLNRFFPFRRLDPAGMAAY